jgi:methionyl-tRNA formyltransferase
VSGSSIFESGEISFMPLRYAFLVLEEHPYGREMLRALLEGGFVPGIIIEEVSNIADVEREKFLTRSAGQPVPPRITQLINGMKVPIYTVANHNDATCKEILEANKPEILVLGGTRIIRNQILEVPTRATVNAHPGLLPWLRGSASVGWALYKDMPVGSTVHFIDPGIDTGDIIYREELPVLHGDTYESLNYKVGLLSAKLMAQALKALDQGEAPRMPQDRNAGETFKVIPEDLLAEGQARLAEGRYSHYAD